LLLMSYIANMPE